MKSMTVGIIGGGVVGNALFQVYSLPQHGLTIRLHDILPERSKHSLLEVLECEVVLLCLPTPARNDGSGQLDLTAVEDFCKAHAGWRKPFVLKSTVPVGTTRRLAMTYDLQNLYHSPEFLTERTAVEDVKNAKGLLVGSPYDGRINPMVYELQKRLAEGKTVWLVNSSSEETEMMKLALNSFYAVKVSFFNELHALCQKLGINYGEIRDNMLSVGMIDPNHTRVPGPDGFYGFGGRCLPKDLSQFICHCIDARIEPVMTTGAMVRSAVDRLRNGSIEEKSPGTTPENPGQKPPIQERV